MSVISFHSADIEDTKLLWPAYLGSVTDASIRTLQYAMHSLFILAALSRFPFGKKEVFEPLVIFDEKNDIHRFVTAGRHVLVGIIDFLSGDGRDNPHYECPAVAWPGPKRDSI